MSCIDAAPGAEISVKLRCSKEYAIVFNGKSWSCGMSKGLSAIIFSDRRNLRCKMHEKLQNATEKSWVQIASQFASPVRLQREHDGGKLCRNKRPTYRFEIGTEGY